VFEASSLEAKYNALQKVLSRMLEIQVDIRDLRRKTTLPSSSTYIDFMIFIPEGLVSLVIGAKGRQIKAFMDESGAEIIVN
jgi:hypothetical protein